MEDRRFAKKGNCIVYAFLAAMTIAVEIFYAGRKETAREFVILFLMITVFISERLTRNQNVSDGFHAKVHTLFYSLTAVLMGVETSNTTVYLVFLVIPMFMQLLYLDKKAYIFMESVLFIQFTLLLFLGFPYMSGNPSPMVCIFYYTRLFLCVITMMYLINVLDIQKKMNYEQECSLDDMLRIISSKCDDVKKASQSKSDFLSHMSHEIRTPINSILGMNEMILRESSEEAIVGYAMNVESAGTTLLSLVNDILDFSKIESEKMEIVPVEYMLSSVINDLVNMMRPRMAQKNLDLKVVVNPFTPDLLYGDDIRIKQILTNLLTNAFKYTDEGSVTLFVDYIDIDDGKIALGVKVQDTGYGIQKEDMNKIFSSFQRVDEKRNRNIEGTGLGLTIASRLVKLMGGEMSVESEYGKGSVFSIDIPQGVHSREPIGEFSDRIENRVNTRAVYEEYFTAPDAKVLVVDDNKMNLTVIIQLLKRTKLRLETAESGEECIALVKRNHYDLILMDHMMPGMDGVETLARLKAEFSGSLCPVIALTANAIAGARDMYLNAGFQDYLSKPIKGEKLEKMLMKWLPPEKICVTKKNSQQEEAAPAQEISQSQETSIWPEPSDGWKEEDPWEEDDFYEEVTFEQELPEASGNAAGLPQCDYPEEMDLAVAEQYSPDGFAGIRINVSVFLEHVPEIRKNLLEAYESDNMEDYVIYVHSMKSNLALIGAEGLSGRARELELEGKAGNDAFIKENHQAFLADYDSFVGKLRKAMGLETEESQQNGDVREIREVPQGDIRELAAKLSDVTECYDLVGMKELVRAIAAVRDVTETQAEVIARLEKAVEALDFIQVKKAAEELQAQISPAPPRTQALSEGR